MTHTCRYSQMLKRSALLFVMAVLCTRLLAGQTVIKIMINGPFDYVTDPQDSNRIVMIAPVSMYHTPVQIFSGDDAAVPPTTGLQTLKPGFFWINFVGRVVYHGTPPPTPSVYQVANISPQVIANAICSPTATGCNPIRYAVSLPKPDYYTTFFGGFGGKNWTGTSQSIISSSQVTSTATVPDPRADDYTTWMVLHYSVSTTPPVAILTGKPDDGTSFTPQSVQFASFYPETPIKAISIVQMGLPDMGNDAQCDTYSHDSFQHAKDLWYPNANLYALFPMLDGSGANSSQIHDAFDYTCVYSALSSARKTEAGKGARSEHDQTKKFLQKQNKAAGSADCHKAQMSINGVVINK